MRSELLYFTGPGSVETREETVGPPGPGEIALRAVCSAVSAGTEKLVYRGMIEQGTILDTSIAGLGARFSYPLRYGYSLLGDVTDTGRGVSSDWLGRRVFCFAPHGRDAVAAIGDVVAVPDGYSDDRAVMFAACETALSLVMDGRPLAGEDVVVFGQGTVGLAVTALLAEFPLGSLSTVDPLPYRRRRSIELGAASSSAPEDLGASTEEGSAGADLVFELSGEPEALGAALDTAGYAGRVIAGSWYGSRADLDLGTSFHRGRKTLTSSQVSRISPHLSGRWNVARRRSAAWRCAASIRPERLITHRLPFDRAGEAYSILDGGEDYIQIVIEYRTQPIGGRRCTG